MGDLAATLATFLQSQTEMNNKLATAQDRMSTAQAELTATVRTLTARVDQVVASVEQTQAQLAALRTDADKDRLTTRTAVTTAS